MAVYVDGKIPFFSRRTRDKNFKMPDAHFHDKHELYYLENGKTKYFIGSEIYLLAPGDFLFIPKGEFHKTDNGGDSSTERLLFVFNDDFIGSEYSCYIDELSEDKHVRLPQEQLQLFREIIRKIEQEAKLRQKNYIEMQKLYLRQILILISRFRQKDNPKKLSETYMLIRDAARYISSNCNQDLSLSALSRKYAVSPGYFSKLFKKVTGVGLNEYVNISRVTAARELLKASNMPITRVAEECGFNDSNYFAQVFKKINGITPKKYALQVAEKSK